jgi:hypothetical protein
MTRTSTLALVGLLAVPALAVAQSGPAGKWMGETQGRGGTQKVTLELKVDGSKLMGMYQQGEQPASEIAEGKVVDASTITFKRTITGRGGDPFTIEYSGKISGNELTLTPMFGGGGPRGGGGGGGRGPMPIMLKRGS